MIKVILPDKCPFCDSHKTGAIITGNYDECTQLKYKYLSHGVLCKIEKSSRPFGRIPNNCFCDNCGAEWAVKREKTRIEKTDIHKLRDANGITDEFLAKAKAQIGFQEYMNKRRRTLLKAFTYFLYIRWLRRKETEKVGEKYG